ncbi:class F sortase [Rathayibacter sp. YIM 133350]|uniref:class F sortase n=1 Tax=Rathayibacter sp. YIM 133350 TaxID=3131992 RepID=UPI00307CF9EF
MGAHSARPSGVPLRRWAPPALAALALVLTGWAITVSTAASAPPSSAPAGSASSPTASRPPTVTQQPSAGTGAASALQDPSPLPQPADSAGLSVARLQIPAIGVDAAVVPLERTADGVLQPPEAWADAGWYEQGVFPGHVGPAVIAGHLDTTVREAVFAHLRDLVAGDAITVTLSDGSTVGFVVDRAIDVAKNAFPTQEVYGPTPDPQLRLITCNGPYDDAAQSYTNNYVVFASLSQPAQ